MTGTGSAARSAGIKARPDLLAVLLSASPRSRVQALLMG
jgi:hypothetical protein